MESLNRVRTSEVRKVGMRFWTGMGVQTLDSLVGRGSGSEQGLQEIPRAFGICWRKPGHSQEFWLLPSLPPSGHAFPVIPHLLESETAALKGQGKYFPGVEKHMHSQKGHGQLQVRAGNAARDKVWAGMLFSTLRCLKGVLTLTSHVAFLWMIYNSNYRCNLGSKMNTPSLYYE